MYEYSCLDRLSKAFLSLLRQTDWEPAMPIYGYDCNKCGHEFETLVRSSEPRRAHLAKALT
jgi:hypothetical protein